MRILVTAGNTWTMLDKVRCITNIFSGNTGASLALEAHRRGHDVLLLTSQPGAVAEFGGPPSDARWRCTTYRTFDDLHHLLRSSVGPGFPDAILHSAAVSDYQSAGVFAPAEGTTFDPATSTFHALDAPKLVDRQAGKVRSDEAELWIRLVRTPKLIDLFREPWGFAGVLVKFKLEVDRSDAELLEIAERSRRQSRADLMTANTLESAGAWAYLGAESSYEKIPRPLLASRLMDAVERLHGER